MYHSSNVRPGPGSIELPRSRAPVVKADALLYVHFERPDLNQARDYLVDFGLLVVSQSEGELFLRGAGSKPYIYRVSRGPAARPIGFGLSVPLAEDLKALTMVPGLGNKVAQRIILELKDRLGAPSDSGCSSATVSGRRGVTGRGGGCTRETPKRSHRSSLPRPRCRG